MIEGTKLLFDIKNKKAYLDGIEVMRDTVQQYVGKEIEIDKWEGTEHRYEHEMWDKLEFRGIEKTDDEKIWYCRGFAYYHDLYGTYIINNRGEKIQILPQSLRQVFWRNGAERHNRYHRILMRGIRRLSPNCRPSDKECTVYIHGDYYLSMLTEVDDDGVDPDTKKLHFWITPHLETANLNESFYQIDKSTLEQLVSEAPEIWVPLRYCAKTANLDAARVYTPKPPSQNANPDDKSCVYVFEFSDGLVKIGVSNNPERRMRNLISGGGRAVTNHFESDFVPTSKAFEIEKAMHKFFQKNRGIGEYFNIQFYDACAKLWEFFYLEEDENA